MPIRRGFIHILVALSWLCSVPGAAQASDAKTLYIDKCGRCHGLSGITAKNDYGRGGFIKVVMLPPGPALNGVYGRPAGQVSGYKYSQELLAAAKAGLVWDRAALDRWLTDSRAMIPGTYMLVKIPQEERAIIIDFLAAQK
ncbi:MAG: hypothetical protein GKR94_10950 [Gammaproteobacteria bacterium]|nr:hypothetical protein [Gammaproteobacteria bacterium]